MVALSPSHPETVTLSAEKLERMLSRERTIERKRTTRSRKLARKAARDPRETPFFWDTFAADVHEPMDDYYASLERLAAEIIRTPPQFTPEGLFNLFYGETAGRARESAWSFIHKAQRHAIAVGSILCFDHQAWLVLDGEPATDGWKTWSLVRLNTRFAVEPATDPRAAEYPLIDIEACPRSIACLDLTNVVRQDFVRECGAFARIGRIPRATAMRVASAIATYAIGREYTFSRAVINDDGTTESILRNAERIWLADRAAQPLSETGE